MRIPWRPGQYRIGVERGLCVARKNGLSQCGLTGVVILILFIIVILYSLL